MWKALRGHSAAGHSGETLGLGTPGRLWRGAGHSGDTLGFGHPREGDSEVGLGFELGTPRDTLGLGTPGMSEE